MSTTADSSHRLRRVLVADDEAPIRAVCRVNLQLAGISVDEATTGKDALAAIERERPDVVLLDIMLPGLDGWEVANELLSQATTADLPIVFLSARAGREDIERGAKLGAVDYIVKPFDPTTLADRLRSTLARLEAGERDQLRQELLEGT
jgi:two-component system, OmpR family, alkaline phosphatase synthesis response regulator PhoP